MIDVRLRSENSNRLPAEFPTHWIREVVRLKQGTQTSEQGKITRSSASTTERKLKRSDWARATSALGPVADIDPPTANVRFVPKADVGRWQPKLTSSGRG